MKPSFKKVEYLEIDLLDLLSYIDKKVTRFNDVMWDKLCEDYYITNDTCRYIDFEKYLTEDYYSDIIVEGVKMMFDEFPELKNDNIRFNIYW